MDDQDRDHRTAPAARRRRDAVLVAVAPVLVLVMAAVGTWHHHHDAQPSWQGGTLGMFAMIDSPSNRLVRGLVRDDAAREARTVIVTPSEVPEEVVRRARIRPTAANLRDLADAWGPTVTGGELVRVEVWAMRFRGHDTSVRLELIAAHGEEAP